MFEGVIVWRTAVRNRSSSPTFCLSQPHTRSRTQCFPYITSINHHDTSKVKITQTGLRSRNKWAAGPLSGLQTCALSASGWWRATETILGPGSWGWTCEFHTQNTKSPSQAGTYLQRRNFLTPKAEFFKKSFFCFSVRVYIQHYFVLVSGVQHSG